MTKNHGETVSAATFNHFCFLCMVSLRKIQHAHPFSDLLGTHVDAPRKFHPLARTLEMNRPTRPNPPSVAPAVQFGLKPAFMNKPGAGRPNSLDHKREYHATTARHSALRIYEVCLASRRSCSGTQRGAGCRRSCSGPPRTHDF